MKPQLKLASALTHVAIIPGARPDRGNHVAYHQGEVNHCPGCGRSNWYVGRMNAECAFCATAIPIAAKGTQS